jgi:outer membrane protein assembly factor BamA
MNICANMARARLIGALSFLLVLSFELQAQTDSLVISSYKVIVNAESGKIKKHYDQRTFKAVNWIDALESLQQDLFSSGYLTPAIEFDTVSDHINVSVNPSIQYKWMNLKVDEKDFSILRRSGVNVNRFRGNVVSLSQFNSLRKKPVRYLENNGFPFAKLMLDSVEITDGALSAKLTIDNGPLVRIDSVVINGNLEIRKSYITNYIGIKEGSLYNESAIKAIPSKLADISFLTESQSAKVFFNKDETKILLFLKERNASRFDGIIGFLPDPNTGGIVVTGDAKVHLENALKQGEEIDVNWRRLQSNTQELTAGVVSPFVLNSPISIDVLGGFYRRDTTFTDLDAEIGLRYVVSQNNYLRAFIARKSTSLISTLQYQNKILPPEYLDRKITNYGLGLRFSKLDYKLNPAKGYVLLSSVSVGDRRVVKNSRLPEIIYENLTMNSIQFNARVDASYYLSYIKRVVWHQQLKASSVSNNQLFNNDAERIGGLNTLRGFNEQSIFATTYALLRNEFRYQFERDGYAFLFFDGAWYENQSIDPLGATRDTPFGFGAGFTFGTKAGIFSISYALGKELGNPILLASNKIHFGFVSVF